MLPSLSQELAIVPGSPFWATENRDFMKLVEIADRIESEEDIPPAILDTIEMAKDSIANPWKWVNVVNAADFFDASAPAFSTKIFDRPRLLGMVGENTYLLWVGTSPEHPRIAALFTPGTSKGQDVTAVGLDALLATLQSPVTWTDGNQP